MPDMDSTFTSSMAALYDGVLGPMLFAPFAPHIADVVAAGAPATVLETAAGTGRLTYQLAARLPDAAIVATDLNQSMLDFGATVGAAANVTWRQADAQSLPFGDAEFEAVACQFGAMFFPDRVGAFAEARRVLVEGGALTVALWDRIATNAISRVADSAIRPYIGDVPSFMARVPHGYFDKNKIHSDVTAAGFASVEITTVTMTGTAPSAAAVAHAFGFGTPTLAQVPAPHEPIVEAMADALREHLGTGSGEEIEGVITALVVVAR